MCGRYQFDSSLDIEELQNILEQLNRDRSGSLRLINMKTGEICPTDIAPVLIDENGCLEPEIMKWGFPSWDNKNVIINARAETICEKPMFKSSLEERRCIIPSTGFYEWKQDPDTGKKMKYLIRTEKPGLLYMAGIFNHFKDRTTGLLEPAFVIITTDANDYMEGIHDRMPLILEGNQISEWIEDETAYKYLYEPNRSKLIIGQAI